MKKIISLILSITVLLSCGISVYAVDLNENEKDVDIEIVYSPEEIGIDSIETVTDIDKSDESYEAFKRFLDKGVISLLGPEEIGPEYNMSRVEYLAILRKYFTGREGGVISETPYFYDVDIFAWYAIVVEWARNTNTAVGVGNEYFKPEDKITNEQMITMLYNYVSKNNVSLNTIYIIDDPVNDMEEVSDWAYMAVTWANQLQLLNKDENGNVNPKELATRRDMVNLLYNFDNVKRG